MKTLIIPNDHISKVCDLLNQLIGDVTSKNLFTGYGLFHKEKDMFAVWAKKQNKAKAKMPEKTQTYLSSRANMSCR